jgi:HAMP domain-containing protein
LQLKLLLFVGFLLGRSGTFSLGRLLALLSLIVLFLVLFDITVGSTERLRRLLTLRRLCSRGSEA